MLGGTTSGNDGASFPGDLISCALGGAAEPWQAEVARGLITDPVAALSRLGAYDLPDVAFYRGVLAWMAGDDDAACRGLERLEDSRARALLAVIRRPRVAVLTQIPHTGSGAFRLLDGIEQDAKFEIRNIGGGTHDIPLRAYETLAAHGTDGSGFAFYVCAMIEWQHPPLDLSSLACPTIGYTSDFDAQLMTFTPWVKAFDHVMVCDQLVEYPGVLAIKGSSVHAFPVVFCAPPEQPPMDNRPRDIDVFFSGTLFSPYQPDKSDIVRQLLQVPGLRVALLDGHVSNDDYYTLLSRSRITQNFCRHPGAMLTRALESLALGSIALVQDGSVHTIWGGPEAGIFTFPPQGVADAVQRILADYDTHGAACRAQAAHLRRTFSPEAVASKFFRYATVLAATAPRARQGVRPDARRHAFLIGPRPSMEAATRHAAEGLAYVSPDQSAAARLNLRARERVLLHCQALHYREAPPAGDLSLAEAVDDLRRAVLSAPNDLVVRFNLIRLLLHVVPDGGPDEGASLAADTVQRPADSWDVDPGDDVYPWDFFGTWFNARGYFDTAIRVMAGAADDRVRLVELIYASLHNYLALGGTLADARAACAFDAEFPHYRLRLGRLLAAAGHASEAAAAFRATVGTEIGGRAFRELEAIAERVPACGDDVRACAEWAERAQSGVLHWAAGFTDVRSWYRLREHLRAPSVFGAVVHKTPAERQPRRFSILVCGVAGRGCDDLLDRLAAQTLPRSEYEIVLVECFEEPCASSVRADVVLSCGQTGLWDHRLQALARAFEEASGETVVVVEPGSPVAPDFLERLLDCYYTPTGATTAGSTHVTVGGWLARGASVRYAAFPRAAAEAVGGFDQHAVFEGDRGTPLELAWRLQQYGLPIVVEEDGVRTHLRLPPWWRLPPFESRHTLLSVAAQLWPLLVSDLRVDPMVGRHLIVAIEADPEVPVLLGSVHGFNLLRHRGRFIGLHQSLGAVDVSAGVATLVRRLGPEHVLVREDLDALRRAAIALSTRRAQASGPVEDEGPRLIETVGDFNIVRALGAYIGLRHGVGTVEFERFADPGEIVAMYGPDNVIVAKSVKMVRKRVLARTPAMVAP